MLFCLTSRAFVRRHTWLVASLFALAVAAGLGQSNAQAAVISYDLTVVPLSESAFAAPVARVTLTDIDVHGVGGVEFTVVSLVDRWVVTDFYFNACNGPAPYDVRVVSSGPTPSSKNKFVGYYKNERFQTVSGIGKFDNLFHPWLPSDAARYDVDTFHFTVLAHAGLTDIDTTIADYAFASHGDGTQDFFGGRFEGPEGQWLRIGGSTVTGPATVPEPAIGIVSLSGLFIARRPRRGR